MSASSFFYPCMAAALVMASCSLAQADVPECAYHLEHAAPGQVLTADQIDANNDCLKELQQESLATELRAKIAESERKMKEKPATAQASSTSGTLPLPGFPTLVPPPSLSEPSRKSGPPPYAPPRIAMIVSDGGKLTATLKMNDGAMLEAGKGTTLPDGAVVISLRSDGVYVRHGQDVIPLSNDDGSSTSAPLATEEAGARFPGIQATGLPGARR